VEYPEDISNRERISCEPIVPFGALCHHDGECRIKPMQQANATASASAPAPMVCKWGECTCSSTHRLEENKCIFVENGAMYPQLAGTLALLCLLFIMFLY